MPQIFLQIQDINRHVVQLDRVDIIVAGDHGLSQLSVQVDQILRVNRFSAFFQAAYIHPHALLHGLGDLRLIAGAKVSLIIIHHDLFLGQIHPRHLIDKPDLTVQDSMLIARRMNQIKYDLKPRTVAKAQLLVRKRSFLCLQSVAYTVYPVTFYSQLVYRHDYHRLFLTIRGIPHLKGYHDRFQKSILIPEPHTP